MEIPLPSGESGSIPDRSANDRWKKGWSSWLLLSTGIGAAVHLVIFILIPAWEIRGRASSDAPMEFIQLDPLVTVGATVEAGDEAVPATPEIDNLEIEVAAGTEMDVADVEGVVTSLIEIFGLPGPSVAGPIVPFATGGGIGAPAPPLEPTEVVPLAPRLALVGPPVQLPVIRNPTVVQRYLRTRYNPIYQEPNGNGHVAVAMWINERGAVEWTAISESSGFDSVDEIALNAFENIALFTPARSEGVRVPVSVVISVPFTARW